MLFYNQLNRILQYFSESEQQYIRDIVDFNKSGLCPEEQYILLKIVNTFDENTTQDKKDFLIEIFEQICVRQTNPSFYIVNGGEDFILTIRLGKNQDLTGSMLVIREDDGTLLSADDVDGTNQPNQNISIIDVSLPEYNFYKLNIMIESPTTQGTASGDVLTLLDTIYLYIDVNVDSI